MNENNLIVILLIILAVAVVLSVAAVTISFLELVFQSEVAPLIIIMVLFFVGILTTITKF